ncbi:hypothetical protein CPC08DRAFT_618484, partial [Agrocybe pediades]
TANRDMKLRKYEVQIDEWEIAEQLCSVLKIFKDATLFFSRSTPNLSKVIPAMDRIDRELATNAISSRYLPSIQAALAMGKKLLNKYYNMTDHSEVYRIAMVLHPRHKLEYFKNAGWQADWIKAARQIVEDEFNRAYA